MLLRTRRTRLSLVSPAAEKKIKTLPFNGFAGLKCYQFGRGGSWVGFTDPLRFRCASGSSGCCLTTDGRNPHTSFLLKQLPLAASQKAPAKQSQEGTTSVLLKYFHDPFFKTLSFNLILQDRSRDGAGYEY